MFPYHCLLAVFPLSLKSRFCALSLSPPLFQCLLPICVTWALSMRILKHRPLPSSADLSFAMFSPLWIVTWRFLLLHLNLWLLPLRSHRWSLVFSCPSLLFWAPESNCPLNFPLTIPPAPQSMCPQLDCFSPPSLLLPPYSLTLLPEDLWVMCPEGDRGTQRLAYLKG